ncbi:MAG: protein kinase, partial [Methyloprofundus sp.]|nr:protein kinase [Methyloprofundus sp.]
MTEEELNSLESTQSVAAQQKESYKTRLYDSHGQNQNAIATKNKLEIGDIINNRFILEEELGRGGMGVVFKAKDLRKEEARDRNPYIALKVLNEEFKSNPGSFIALQRETRKTQELAHPNIITVYDFDKDGGHIYMTMECLEGKPLSILLHEQYFLSCPLKERWSIIRQISLALAYAHQKNIIHLDLKPGNIFVKSDGTVKVLDFGIARVAKEVDINKSAQDLTVFDMGTLGALTPSYASCEMLENQEPDFRDDIYALACVAYEILTNHHPFNKVQATHACFKKMIPLPISEISKKQYKALMHGLAFHREERVASIEQFLQETQLLNNATNTGFITIDSQSSTTLMPWKWFGIIASGLTLVAILWQGYGQYTRPAPTIGTTVKPAPKATLLSKDEQDKTDRMLEIAAMHLMVGRLVEPPGTNALVAYNEVLLIDRQNPVALKGINEIASYYGELAQELWDKGEQKRSIEMLKKGLQASPEHQGLLKFQIMT